MIRFLQCVVWMCVGLLVGCATPPAPVADGDWVSLQEQSLRSPLELANGEKLQVSVRYRLATSNSALLQVRPYCDGVLAPGYRAHVAIPVEAGVGEATGWISFATDVSVDEIRASLVTLPRYRVLVEGRQSVDLTWRMENDE